MRFLCHRMASGRVRDGRYSCGTLCWIGSNLAVEVEPKLRAKNDVSNCDKCAKGEKVASQCSGIGYWHANKYNARKRNVGRTAFLPLTGEAYPSIQVPSQKAQRRFMMSGLCEGR